jgi:hypothetical protein
MNATDSVFHRAVSKLLIEIFNGPPTAEAYILNPGDQGLLRQLESIPAAVASTRPTPDKPSIAAHADHLCYGLEMLNRWISGEENPWATADWNASWQRNTVTEEQWRTLCQKLRQAADQWRSAADKIQTWDDTNAAGALSTIAHTAYHLGAIRQIFAVVKK